MASIVHLVSLLLLAFMVHLLVICDGKAILDVSENMTARDKTFEHFQMIEKKICTTPVPKLYPVDDIYTIDYGIYKPHCVELFRCNNDAGCCQGDSEICAPSKTETVHLHIAVMKINEAKYLLMPFENHTKCECKPLHEVMIDER